MTFRHHYPRRSYWVPFALGFLFFGVFCPLAIAWCTVGQFYRQSFNPLSLLLVYPVLLIALFFMSRQLPESSAAEGAFHGGVSGSLALLLVIVVLLVFSPYHQAQSGTTERPNPSLQRTRYARR